MKNIRIAVTRAAEQAEELAAPLRALGADVIITPLIRIVALPGAALPELSQFDWIIFTSVNGVEAFVAAAGDGLTDVRAKIACVGPATAAAAARHGWPTTAMPEEFVGDAVAEALQAHGELAGSNVLIARAGGARQELPKRLAAAGAKVADVELYRSELDRDGAQLLRRHVSNGDIDVVTFTSGSTVRYFAQEVRDIGRALVAVIGPRTAEAAREHGLQVAIEADPHTTAGLVTAISRYFGG